MKKLAVLILAGISLAVVMHISPAEASSVRHTRDQLVAKIHHLRTDRNYWEDCYRQDKKGCN